MDKQNLGIGSVPNQTWGELYPPEEALKTGTIFKDLNKPFFAADVVTNSSVKIPLNPPSTSTETEKKGLLKKIDEVSFILDDLTLYLDTHLDDQDALSLYQEYSKIRKELKMNLAKKYYPLTRDCINDCEQKMNRFCWQDGPIPWEGACE